MLKTNKTIVPVTMSRGDAGRYEYFDSLGVIEAGDKAFSITIEKIGSENQDIYFKSQINAEQFLLEN